MSLAVPPYDEFEDVYTAKFKVLAARHGVIIQYERDRAANDLGVHLKASGIMTSTRVWFQFKGKRATTLTLDQFKQADEVSISVEIEHLRFWYQSAEPVYLVVYIESADVFLAEDVRLLINRQ